MKWKKTFLESYVCPCCMGTQEYKSDDVYDKINYIYRTQNIVF